VVYERVDDLLTYSFGSEELCNLAKRRFLSLCEESVATDLVLGKERRSGVLVEKLGTVQPRLEPDHLVRHYSELVALPAAGLRSNAEETAVLFFFSFFLWFNFDELLLAPPLDEEVWCVVMAPAVEGVINPAGLLPVRDDVGVDFQQLHVVTLQQ